MILLRVLPEVLVKRLGCVLTGLPGVTLPCNRPRHFQGLSFKRNLMCDSRGRGLISEKINGCQEMFISMSPTWGVRYIWTPQVSVLGPLWFTVSIRAIFHFSWLLLNATHITMRHSTLTFSLQFVLKNVEHKMFFNERKKMAGSWRHHVKCQSFHIISLTVLPSMNLKSKWKVPSEKIIGSLYWRDAALVLMHCVSCDVLGTIDKWGPLSPL